MSIAKKKETKEISQDLKFLRDKNRQKVKGKFIFHEVPGGQMDFLYLEYPGDPLQRYSLKDGEIVSIPLGVAKHLNKNVWYPSYSYKNDEQGRPVVTVGQKVRRCSFQSLEFIDVEGVAPIGSPINSAIDNV